VAVSCGVVVECRLFGFPTFAFPVHSAVGFVIFHGLVWVSILVIAGVMLAMHRRMRDHGAAALQQFGEDFLPLILLFAVSVTGLMLTASYTWMRGRGYELLALLHAVRSSSPCCGCRSASSSTCLCAPRSSG
jgi:nitrate reductase gamma subunit